MRGADLSRANLTGTYLDRANLRETYLTGADMRETYLSGADMSDADSIESTNAPDQQMGLAGDE
jgi:uncharacterized protein YjbI with pentapeptide repeats